MKKFKFQLATLLKVSEHKKDQAQIIFAEADTKLLVEEENIKRDKLISYGAYEAELTNDFKEYLENFSDHLPIYLVAKLDGGS